MSGRRPRHYHFAPAERAEALDGLWGSPADGLFIDLEDGVRAELKEQARQNARRFLEAPDRSGDKRALLRINAIGGPDWRADVELCAPLVDRLIVPLLEGPDPLADLDEALAKVETEHELPPGSRRLHLLVETAGAVIRLAQLVAATPRVEGLLFGQADFLLSVGASGIGGGQFRPGSVVEWTHPAILLHARAHGLETATPVWAPASDAGFQVTEMRRLYELGYDALVVGSATGVARADEARRGAPEDLEFARGARATYDQAVRNGAGPAVYRGWGIEGAMARVADRAIERSADG